MFESTDGGDTWSGTSATFLTADPNQQIQGNLMPLSGGDILLTYLDCPCVTPGTFNIESRVLSDAGTWDGSPLSVGTITLDSINRSTFWGAM